MPVTLAPRLRYRDARGQFRTAAASSRVDFAVLERLGELTALASPERVATEFAAALRGEEGYDSYWPAPRGTKNVSRRATGTSRRRWRRARRVGAGSAAVVNDALIESGRYRGSPYASFVATGRYNIPARARRIRANRAAVPLTWRKNFDRIARRLTGATS